VLPTTAKRRRRRASDELLDAARYAANEAARDSAILLSIAIQHGADVEMIRAALCRDRLAALPNETETPPSGACVDSNNSEKKKAPVRAGAKRRNTHVSRTRSYS
jgi:hypothetical protein